MLGLDDMRLYPHRPTEDEIQLIRKRINDLNSLKQVEYAGEFNVRIAGLETKISCETIWYASNKKWADYIQMAKIIQSNKLAL